MGQQKDTEEEVRSWGFSHVYTWSDGPGAHYRTHSHPRLTTHVVLKGEMTISFPDSATKQTYGVGSRIDVDANQRHEVWMGGEGCTYVIGE